MIQRPRGTRDLLPPEARLWQAVEDVAQGRLRRASAADEIRTPCSRPPSCSCARWARPPTSSTRRCTRFPDRKGRSLTLRPEGTAGRGARVDRERPLRPHTPAAPLLPGADVPLRADAARAVPAVLADRPGDASAPTRRSRTPRCWRRCTSSS